MDPKKIAAGLKGFRLTLVRWLGTTQPGDGEIDSSLHFIAVALKDISPESVLGESPENTVEGLEEIEHELGVLGKSFVKQRRSSKANKARQFQRIAMQLISEIEKLD